MNKVLLPKEEITQKLDRDKLTLLNASIKDYVNNLYENSNDEYIIQDGEPYANGELHLGHFLNKTLKDFVVKYYLTKGKKVRVSFGWDCHGLPIENKAKEMSGDLIQNAKLVATKYCDIQNKTLELFGIYPTEGRFKTMDIDFIERELYIYHQLLNAGLILKKNKPTWYSPTLKTVLANSEIEYKKIEDESLYFLFNSDSFKLLVWTTTEWTVNGNQAVCLSNNIKYVKTVDNIICSESFAIENNLDYDLFDVSNIKSYHNHNGDLCPIIYDDYVSDDKTGIVHLCGGHGDEDYRILMDNNITPKNVCDKIGLLKHIEDFKIDEKFVYKREIYTHDYPIDWREGNKVYKVLTEQTYLDFDLNKIKTCLKEIKLSSKDRNRLSTTIFSRKDWCISRQRKWGVKIPNSNDILDVWFDSGSTFMMYDKPADIYIEGSDQHRGWFQSSIILASMIGRVPTKRIITHGFIVDNTLEKLSKSKGNGGSLEKLYETYNPDVLRLWVLLSDFKNDIVFSEDSLKNSGKQYFKIRNFLRYLFNNLYIYDYDETKVDENIFFKVKELENKFDLLVNEFDLNKAVRGFVEFINYYSSLLTEDIKNEFYESDTNSNMRIKYETEFYYVLKHLNKLLFSILPFLSMEIKKAWEEKRKEKDLHVGTIFGNEM
jgi:isoleucyl-tRNA synthetase